MPNDIFLASALTPHIELAATTAELLVPSLAAACLQEQRCFIAFVYLLPLSTNNGNNVAVMSSINEGAFQLRHVSKCEDSPGVRLVSRCTTSVFVYATIFKQHC